MWAYEPPPLPPHKVDVAIVGGGPAGLATANALLRVLPDLHVEVFERMPFSAMGAGVLLNVNGQNALEAIDPALYYHMLERSVVLTKTCFFDGHTGELKDQHMTNNEHMLAAYGKAPRLIGWHEIRQTLLEALPEDSVQFLNPVMSYKDVEGRVEAYFLDGPDVHAKLLVGADGWFSNTRFQCLHDPMPEFQGVIFWRARIPWRKGLPKDHTRWYVEGDRRTSRFAAIIPVSSGDVVWQAGAPVEYLRKVGLEVESQAPRSSSIQGDDSFQEDPKKRCLAVFHDFVRAFTDVVDLTDAPACTEHPLHQRPISALPPPSQGWGRGRVTLVGDAAHTSPPNGQGCNLAFEDALALAHSIQRLGLTEEALRDYEAQQIPRVRDVLEYGTDFADASDRERVIYSAKFEPLRLSNANQGVVR